MGFGGRKRGFIGNFHNLELTVPPGASHEEMSVSWGDPDLTGIEIPFGVKLFSQYPYRFSPSGLKFSNEEKLRFCLKWDPLQYPGGFPSGLQLYYLNRESRKLELVPGGINEQTGDFEAEISHFSEYVPGITGNWLGDSLNPYADYVHAGEEHVGISNLSLIINSTVYSLPLRGGTQLNFTRVFRNQYMADNLFSISNNWYWDFLSYYTLDSRLGWGKIVYKNGNVIRYIAGGTVYEVHMRATSQSYSYTITPYTGIEAIYFSDGTRIELGDGYEVVYDANGNWYRYQYTKFAGKDRTGYPRNFLRVTSLTDCLGREFYFRYKMEDTLMSGLNNSSNCPRPCLDRLEQKMADGSYKVILRRTYQPTCEYFSDALNRTTSYVFSSHYYGYTNSCVMVTAFDITRINYPSGCWSQYQYSYNDSYALSRVSSQKFYRPGAGVPSRTVGYQIADYAFNGAWYYNGKYLPLVTVNDGTTLKKYYLSEAGNTHHEETYDSVTQKLRNI
jgi:hypothetical protein